jgi:protoheme IX farnesyltransferase
VATFKEYYSLVKPGVLYGNAITAVAGFLLASQGQIRWGLFAALTIGTTLLIASACALNNYLDQDIDSKMARTKSRVLVAGKVKGRHAIIIAVVLGLVGLGILVKYTNVLVVAIGLVGYVDYVVLYGMLSKRMSYYGTLVGSISGAAPILAGYCAVTGGLDAGAVIVFAVLFLWQMPEFYSIAIYRQKEYMAAGIPVISVVKGIPRTRVHIFFFTLAFVVALALLTVFHVAGSVYFVVMMALGLYWLWLAAKGLRLPAGASDAWARRMFRFSLVVLLAFCAMISVDAWLP